MDIPLPGHNEGGDDFEALRERLAAMPHRTRRELLLNSFAQALDHLGREEIGHLRERVVMHFGADNMFVEVIDGHLALRDIAAMS